MSPLLLLAQEAAPSTVGAGQVTGGWEFVWAAYAVSWVGIVAYTLSLWLRLRGQQVKEGPK